LFARSALLVVVALLAASCGGSNDRVSGPSTSAAPSNAVSRPMIRIGAQSFGESAILAQIYGQALAAKGYPVTYPPFAGARSAVYDAFETGAINFTPEYAASALEFLDHNAGEATPDIGQTTTALNQALQPKQLQALTPSPARDNNALVVTPATAARYKLTKISDLQPFSGRLRFGGPPDCFTNPFCTRGLQERYGIDLRKNFTAYDFGGPKTKLALASGAIDVALLFSTDAAISDNHWVELQDDKGFINADNVVPVVSNTLVNAYGPRFANAVNAVSASITTPVLLALNKQAELDGADPSAIAKAFLASHRLVPA
jgi:osmoprotectant transport system substrate-binding protein